MRILLRCSEFVHAKRAHICCGLRRNRRTAGRRMRERSGCRAADGMVLPGGFLENALSFLDKTDEKAGTRRAFRHAGKAGALRAGGKICSGTTVTMVFVRGRRFVLVHLGDSRAYQLCRKRCLNREKQTGTRQLSQDHEEGGVLRRCVGAFGLEVPQLYTGTLDDGDMLLLCTDGFYKKAPPDFSESACTRNGKQGNCIGG